MNKVNNKSAISIRAIVYYMCVNVTGIERLSKLTKLVLTHNSLGDDPFLVDSSISHLTHLQTLDLGMNELTEFPKVVIQLPT